MKIRDTTTGRFAGSLVALALAVTGMATPAQAAPAPARTAAAATAKAGATWSQAMRRKLDLTAQSARLTALLPSLRGTATARAGDVTRAQTAQTALATPLATATAANLSAHTNYLTARTAAATATKALAAEQKRRPASAARVAAAKRAVTVANATLHSRAVTTGQAAAALKTAQAGYAAAARQVAAASTAYQAATGAVGDAQQQIAATPAQVSALAAQAAAVGQLVVTQSRASFKLTDTTQVYGITVNKIIAYPFQRMIDDAARAGIQLSGGGFRTQQQQIALRTTNGCPDVWTAPASSCRVPTAIPGRSLHELGLAIDLTSAKKIISSRTNPAFKWLAANAANYGFANLPSEPWHWSITGN